METLNFSEIAHNSRLARAVPDVGMGGFLRLPAYKCAWHGTAFVPVDCRYPSSKTCSCGGARKQALMLSERTCRCVACGFEWDRDANAAATSRRSPRRPGGPAPTRRPVGRTGLPARTVGAASTGRTIRFRFAREVEKFMGSGDRFMTVHTRRSPFPGAYRGTAARAPGNRPGLRLQRAATPFATIERQEAQHLWH